MKKILLYALCIPALIAAVACSDDSDEMTPGGGTDNGVEVPDEGDNGDNEGDNSDDGDKTPEPRIETISFEACEFNAGKTDNSDTSNVVTTYEEFGASFSYKNFYSSIGGVVIGSLSDTSENADSKPSWVRVYGDKEAETHGADGTAKFAAFCFNKYVSDLDMSFAFAEGVAKKIVSAKVNNSAALYQYMKYGYYSNAGLVEGEYCDIIFTGYDAEGNETGTARFTLGDYRDGKEYVCSEWTTVDLTALGEVNKVVLTVDAQTESTVVGTENSSEFSVCVDEIQFEVPAEETEE